MARVLLDRFPDGKRKAMTMSYDDAVVQDRRLIDIFNHSGIKGTFHVNSGLLGTGSRIPATEVAGLYEGHEVSVHGVMHCNLPHLSAESVVTEILEDRRALEQLVGYPVRGMSYANGSFDDRVVALLPMLGIEYARTTQLSPNFAPPFDFLRWGASSHHHECIAKAEAFLGLPEQYGLQLLYVWGHSYEFDNNDNWDLIEKFCEMTGGRDDTWYATNIEVVDYIKAMRGIRCSADEDILFNASSTRVWLTDCSADEQKPLSIAPGETITL